MTDLIDDLHSAALEVLDRSGQIHFLIVDDSLLIRHISHSLATLCGRKYFDLVQSKFRFLPLFIKEGQDFCPIGESDWPDQLTNQTFEPKPVWIYTTDNQYHYVYAYTDTLTLNGKTFTLLAMIAQQVTADMHQQAEMQRQLFDSSNEAIVITDAAATMLEVNPAFTRITGYTAEEAIGKPTNLIASGYHNDDFYKKLWHRLNSEGRWQGKLINRSKNGDLFTEHCNIRAIYSSDGSVQNYVSIFSEISNYQEGDSDQTGLPLQHDGLTGLPKRALFEDRLEQALGYAKRHNLRVVVYYFNLDNFAQVNERHGIQTGDKVIQAVVKSINKHIREEDTLSRIVGDEFALHLRDIPADFEIDEFSERLLTMIRDACEIAGLTCELTASVGVTYFPSDQSSAGKLIRHAIHAMDLAKSEGGNCVIHYSTEREREKQLARQAKVDIFNALDSNQMQLHVQPQMNMTTHTLSGVELLIRWVNAAGDTIYPDQFLNSQRDKDLLIRVDKWVVNEAIRLLDNELSMLVQQQCRVGINLTPSSIQDPDFHEWLASQLSIVSPEILSALEFEILENDALNNLELTRALLERLQPMGIRFSLDDFGTGYSSLSIFNQLSVNTVKIDRSFVRDMVKDHKNLSLVKAICHMSQIFNRELIAEGVEFKEQAELLRQAGCTNIQGFGIAKPMSAEGFAAWLPTLAFSEDWEAPTD